MLGEFKLIIAKLSLPCAIFFATMSISNDCLFGCLVVLMLVCVYLFYIACASADNIHVDTHTMYWHMDLQ